MDFFVRIIAKDETGAATRSAKRNIKSLRDERGRFVAGAAGGRSGRGRGGALGFGGDLALSAQAMDDFSRRARTALLVPLKLQANYEASLDAVGARLTGSEEEIAASLKKIDEASRSVGLNVRGVTSTEGTGIAEFLAQAGWSPDDIAKSQEPIAKFAKAMKTDVVRTSDVVSDVMGQFNIPANQLETTLGRLTVGINSANLDLLTFFEAAKQGGPVMSTLGNDISDAVTVFGALANVGIKGSLGGTTVKSMVRVLDPRGKRGKQAARALGVSRRDLLRKGIERDGKLDIPVMLREMAKTAVAKDMKGTEVLRNLKGLTGQESLAGMSALMAVEFQALGQKIPKELAKEAAKAGVTSDQLNKAKSLNEIGDQVRAAGVKELEKAYNQATDNLKGSTEELMANLEETGRVIGEELSPVVRELLPPIKDAVVSVASWAKENPETVRTIGKVVGAFAVIGPVLTPVVLGLSVLKTSLGLIGGAGGLAMKAATALGASGLGGSLKPLVGKAGTLMLAAGAFYAIRDGALELINAGKEAASLRQQKADIRTNIDAARANESGALRKSIAGRSTAELNAFLSGQGIIGEDGKAMLQRAGTRSVTARFEKSTEGAIGRLFGGGPLSTVHFEGGAREQALRELISRGKATDLQRAEIVAFDAQRKVLKDAEGSRPEDHRIQSKVQAEVSRALATAKLDVELRVDKKGRIEVSAASSDVNVSTTQELDTGAVN